VNENSPRSIFTRLRKSYEPTIERNILQKVENDRKIMFQSTQELKERLFNKRKEQEFYDHML
jgi:hypothetical protein